VGNDFDFPDLGFGLGLRAPHYDAILTSRPDVGWFEIISENFIGAHQGYRDFLADLRSDYPFVMHGVSLSIGSTDPLDRDYLARLKSFADFLTPAWVSDHLCFTGVQGRNTHDLLPVPYTEEALLHIAARIRQVQDILERPLVLENPSTYIAFDGQTLSEPEFIASLAHEADCALLLDVNNVHVSAFNHGLDARAYIDAIPARRIAQIHLAGHKDCGDYKIDTHDREVPDAVWDLYRYTLAAKGFHSTMIEWDDAIPEFSVLLAELDKAQTVAGRM
jgi:uncharacterized protein (UPF0276 family)